MFATRELLKAAHGGSITDKTFVIQGFGNVGSWAARLFHEQGGKVLAVSDVSGALFNDKGLDIPAVVAHVAAGNALAEFPGGTSIPASDILKVPCDVLVPAAIGGVLTETTAKDVQCKYVVEAANGPTTPPGDKVLRDKGITVLPDIFVNAGMGAGRCCVWVCVYVCITDITVHRPLRLCTLHYHNHLTTRWRDGVVF